MAKKNITYKIKPIYTNKWLKPNGWTERLDYYEVVIYLNNRFSKVEYYHKDLNINRIKSMIREGN